MYPNHAGMPMFACHFTAKSFYPSKNIEHILRHEELKLRTAQVLEAKFFYLSPTPGMSPGSAY